MLAFAIVAATGHSLAGAAAAQPDWARVEQPVQRRAFVLGVPDYAHLPRITTVPDDLRAMKSTLAQLNFEITLPVGALDRTAIMDAFDAFARQVRPGDVVLIYFSGHGFEQGRINYLAPAELSEPLPQDRAAFVAVGLDYFMAQLEKREPGLVMFLLDSCRTERVADADDTSPAPVTLNGFDKMDSPLGTTIIYAAGPRSASFSRVSRDPPDVPSLFTRAVAASFVRPNARLYTIFNSIAENVQRTSLRRQKPWLHDNGGGGLGLVLNQDAAYREAHAAAWAAASSAPEADLALSLKDFISNYPDSPFLHAARARLSGIPEERP